MAQGKSSLVPGGLVPRLQRTRNWSVLRFPPSEGLVQLKGLLAEAAVESSPLRLLVADQFEEAAAKDWSVADRAELLRTLWGLATAPEPCTVVVLTLQWMLFDQMDEVAVGKKGTSALPPFSGWKDPTAGWLFDLDRKELDVDLAAAIEKPAEAVGLSVEGTPGLVQKFALPCGRSSAALISARFFPGTRVLSCPWPSAPTGAGSLRAARTRP